MKKKQVCHRRTHVHSHTRTQSYANLSIDAYSRVSVFFSSNVSQSSTAIRIAFVCSIRISIPLAHACIELQLHYFYFFTFVN